MPSMSCAMRSISSRKPRSAELPRPVAPWLLTVSAAAHRLEPAARAAGSSLWAAALTVSNQGATGRGSSALRGFLELIERMAHDIDGMPLFEQVDHVINNSGLIEH